MHFSRFNEILDQFTVDNRFQNMDYNNTYCFSSKDGYFLEQDHIYGLCDLHAMKHGHASNDLESVSDTGLCPTRARHGSDTVKPCLTRVNSVDCGDTVN